MAKRIAITGFSFRLPGTKANTFWQNLFEGKDLVSRVDPDRWSHDTFLHPNQKHPGTSYTFAAGSIGDISLFDPGFFGISPREAAMLDPQQRLLLEMSWEALENSGIKPSTIGGTQSGVFIGIATADYSYRLADDPCAIEAFAATGNTTSIAANRISYFLDLRGPSMAIDTACSSSLVAFHQACRSILSGECNQALAGGISLHVHPHVFITFSKASMLSKNGRCRVFDSTADGYVRSEGGGIFFLKDYDQAVADGNPILAVVANSAINTDGHKSGLTVPNPASQAELLRQTYAQAGIDPVEIDYLEAHGTGTVVGDPIEAQAIGMALAKMRPKNKPLLIGSVKSNLGHLEAASGVAGLVKALYCIQHRQVPATIGIQTPNPHISFDDWNIQVVTETQKLKKNGKLVIGVNSFGFGGANAHVILESHEPLTLKPYFHPKAKPLPIIISAKDPIALKALAAEFSALILDKSPGAFYDIAYNAVFRREWHEQRAIIYGNTPDLLAKALLDFSNDAVLERPLVHSGMALKAPAGPAFIYSGNGSQWAGMGKRLLAEERVFRDAVIAVDTIFHNFADFSLVDELAGRNGDDRYEHTEISQPALFALQVGITKMLQVQGVNPTAVAGHSVGEVAAAWASEALSLEDAVKVIYYRSCQQGKTKGGGAMTAVGLNETAARTLLAELDLSSSLVIAGVNSSSGVTLAGNLQGLELLEHQLEERQIFYKRLALDYAFHSPAMDKLEAGILKDLADLQPQISKIPFYSTVTGAELEGGKLNAEYWWRNIRQPVLFQQAINSILNSGTNIFMEIGPHAVLRSYIKDCLKHGEEGLCIPTLFRGDDSAQLVWQACSQAAIAGVNIDWPKVFPYAGNFVQLPNYPWQRERHWHPVTAESAGSYSKRKFHPFLGYPLPQHELIWENKLSIKINPCLADHVVGEATVFPGAGFSELALAASLAWHPQDFAEIEELEIRLPLLLNRDNTKLMRFGIDAKDGSFTIKSRELCSTEEWTLNTTGRIKPDANGILLQQQERITLPQHQPDFNDADHEALSLAVGLSYGPAFKCIDYGWIEGNSVLAAIKIPDSIQSELAQTHIHPAVLDCSFQLIFQLLKDELDIYPGVTFIPVKIGRICFRNGLAMPAQTRATLLRRSSHSLVADFTIYDADGYAIAVVKDVRFRSVRLIKNKTDDLNFLDYFGIPKPHHFTVDSRQILSFEQVRSAIADLAKQMALKGTHRRYSEEVDPLLDSLCNRFSLQAFQQLSADGEQLATKEILAFQTATPEIEPYLKQLLALAKDDQSIVFANEGYKFQPGSNGHATAQDIWNALVADYPDYFQIVHSVGLIGLHLPALLNGSNTLAQICPRDSTLADLLRQALGAEGKQKLGKALRRLINQGMSQMSEGQRLGILEISDGSPLFAMDACVSMDFDNCDYTFAGTSQATLENTDRLKERFPGVNTRLIGASSEQAVAAFCCQIAIVTLNFNTLEESVRALDYARAHLCAGGSLILLGQHPSRWIDFVFGVQLHYWSLAQNNSWISKQRSTSFWEQQLKLFGLTDVELFEFSPNTQSGPFLFIANRPEEALSAIVKSPIAAPRSWLVIADQKGCSATLSDQLSKALHELGDISIQAQPRTSAELETLLTNNTANYGELDGIVYLAGLCDQADQIDAEAIVEQQVGRCTDVANIMRACEATQTQATCWVVTSGAVAELLPQHSQNEPRTRTVPVDAAVWGFGRTLLNETANFAVRLIDLESPRASEAVITALVAEFAQTDGEQEIILTRHGARYVPRLRIDRGLLKTSQPIEDPRVKLAFKFPGQLRNLRWEAHPTSAIADQELEVEVIASGLNFRDVMYALGLLSDEAIETGFAGPTLGLEFSGIVRKVGGNVKGFLPGDNVVGFGSASFGNRVVTNARAVTFIPPGISFESAATIPSVFFTVYYALHHLARLQADEKILIHGAAGGVGIAAIQISKWIGAEIYATAGSDEKRDFLRLLGVNHIFDSRSLTFSDEILAQTGQNGVDVVLNSLSGEAINRNLQILKPFGRFLELGKRDFYENTKIGLRPFRNNISYFGIDADQLMVARPELTQKLFEEVMDLFAKGVLTPLPYHVFEADDIVDAFRYMQQARQIGKIVITYRNGVSSMHYPRASQQNKLQLSGDASYLVTGGLGGFGLKTAEWLVDKGARHLVLISRSGPKSLEAQRAIARLKKQGVNIHAVSCDVCDKQAVTKLLVNIAETMPPLKGIVHAATVINDGLIRNMDADQIHSVLAPKVLGAQYLHEMTSDKALDFFVLFSSATTLFGNPGQANYVAANAYLDALAYHRRSLGLPATCVRWGAIDDVGFLARNEKIKDALQSRMGGSAINSNLALDVLERMLVADRSNIGVMEMDWKALSRFLPSAGSPKFSELVQCFGSNEEVEEGAEDLQQLLSKLSESELLEMMTAMIKAEVSEILRMPIDKIDQQRSIYEMGLDSLMGVELVIALESRFGIKLQVMTLSQTPTIQKLSERIIQQLKEQNEPEPDAGENNMAEQVRQIASQHGAEVSIENITSIAETIQSIDYKENIKIIH